MEIANADKYIDSNAQQRSRVWVGPLFDTICITEHTAVRSDQPNGTVRIVYEFACTASVCKHF